MTEKDGDGGEGEMRRLQEAVPWPEGFLQIFTFFNKANKHCPVWTKDNPKIAETLSTFSSSVLHLIT